MSRDAQNVCAVTKGGTVLKKVKELISKVKIKVWLACVRIRPNKSDSSDSQLELACRKAPFVVGMMPETRWFSSS